MTTVKLNKQVSDKVRELNALGTFLADVRLGAVARKLSELPVEKALEVLQSVVDAAEQGDESAQQDPTVAVVEAGSIPREAFQGKHSKPHLPCLDTLAEKKLHRSDDERLPKEGPPSKWQKTGNSWDDKKGNDKPWKDSNGLSKWIFMIFHVQPVESWRIVLICFHCHSSTRSSALTWIGCCASLGWYVGYDGRQAWVEARETVFTCDKPEAALRFAALMTYLASNLQKTVFAEHAVDEDDGKKGKKKASSFVQFLRVDQDERVNVLQVLQAHSSCMVSQVSNSLTQPVAGSNGQALEYRHCLESRSGRDRGQEKASPTKSLEISTSTTSTARNKKGREVEEAVRNK
eukprot:Skav219405  [mRNA]  locus=scaffold1139:98792:109516:+ [translate_table: standard]